MRLSSPLQQLHNSAREFARRPLLDLGVAGVIIPDKLDALVERAIITYCKMSFGLPEDYDRLKRSYDEQKAQLSNASGYTDWKVTRNV